MSEDTNKASQSEEEQIQENPEDVLNLYSEMDRAAEEVQGKTEVAEEKEEEAKEEEPEKAEAKAEDELEKEVEEENVSRETIDEEPTDNAERSKLGRRVKGMENTLAEILAAINKKSEPESKKEPEPEPDLDEEFYVPTTKKEFLEQVASIIENPAIRDKFRKMSESEKQEEQNRRQSYQDNYLKTLSEFEDDELYDEVQAVMLDESPSNPYNRLYDYNTPQRDAEKNFMAAKLHVLEKKLKGEDKKLNLRQDTRNPSKPDIETKNTQHVKKEVQLDEHAASFIKNLNNRGENTEELMKRAFA